MSNEEMGSQDAGTEQENQPIGTESEASQEDAILDELDTEANPENVAGAGKEEQPQPRKIRVKIDGIETDVDEAEAANGYMRQQEFSRYMQKAQADMQQAQQVRERYQQQLSQFIPESVARIQALQQASDQARAEGNWEALAAYQHDLNSEAMRYQAARSEQDRMQQEQETQQAEYRRTERIRTEQALEAAIPEWRNHEVGKKELGEVNDLIGAEVSKFYGDEAPRIMRDMMDGLYGPMPFVWARKAIQYDKLMAKVAQRKASKAETSDAPPPARNVRSSGGASKDPDKMSADEWLQWRNAQLRKQA